MRLVHEQGHFGVDRTCEQLRHRAYRYGWKNRVKWNLDIEQLVHSIFVGSHIDKQDFNQWCVGHHGVEWQSISQGNIKKSRNGYEYILTVMDYFRKWAEAYPIRDHKPTTVARVLLGNCFTRLGMPEEIISDQGAEFEVELFTELCKSLNVSKLRTSPYRPSTNGMIERYQRTLNQMLGKVVDETQSDWNMHVPAAAAAYRASELVVTGFTPNFMMLGREVRAPVDIVLGAPAGEEKFWASSHEFVANAQQRYRKAYAIARENLKVQASRRKVVYDRKVVKKKFRVGQWV